MNIFLKVNEKTFEGIETDKVPPTYFNTDYTERESMFSMKDGRLLNIRNRCMKIEYEFECKRLGLVGSDTMTREQRRAWELRMIEKYLPPEEYCLFYAFHAMGTAR